MTPQTPASGVYNVSLPASGLQEGTQYSVAVTATSSAGAVISTPAPLTVMVDRAPPSIGGLCLRVAGGSDWLTRDGVVVYDDQLEACVVGVADTGSPVTTLDLCVGVARGTCAVTVHIPLQVGRT